MLSEHARVLGMRDIELVRVSVAHVVSLEASKSKLSSDTRDWNVERFVKVLRRDWSVRPNSD